MMKRLTTTLLAGAVCFASACSGGSADAKPEDQTATPSSKAASDVAANGWRTVNPENLIVIDTAYGLIGIELYPEIAPNHTARIKELARSKFYDNVSFHRVIDGFMNQTGDGSNGDGTGDSDLPDLGQEFLFRRTADMGFTLVDVQGDEQRSIEIGFYKGMPVASQPLRFTSETEDGNVGAFGLHCKGVTSMARTSNPNSANSQFFLMRAWAAHLDTKYTVWGNTVMGYEHLERPKVGTVGDDGFVPDQMNWVRVAADMPEAERPKVQVMDTGSPAFTNYMKTKKKEDGTYPHICDIPVPSKTF